MSTQSKRPADQGGTPPDLNATQRDVLTAIKHLGGSPHGAAIKEFLDTRRDGGFPEGVLYPSLNAMIAKGILEKQDRDGRSNDYFFTAEGDRIYAQYVAWVDAE